jgi:hypothetical protein
MAYNQPKGVLNDPVKARVAKTQENETVSSVDRTNTNQRLTDMPVEDRPMGNGEVYSKSDAATRSTTGTIGGNKPFKYKSGNKIYNYVPGVQNDNPTTGIRLN